MIETDALTVRRRDATILAGITLSLPSTGSVAVIGPNGAGKSTFLRQLAGLDMPSAGEVRTAGSPLAHLPAAQRARMIGYVPQQFTPHWDLRVIDLVRLGAERIGGIPAGRLDDLLEEYGLTVFRRRRWSALSGGERARVLVAMVLAVDPPVLIADEPGASLDIRHRLALVEMLARRGRDRLCVVAMHDLDLAFRCFDRIVVLDRGRLVADGPADELFHDARLDGAFGVAFVRLDTPHGRLLQASATMPPR